MIHGADDTVIALSGILGSTVRSALADERDVLDRMTALGARVVLFELRRLATDEDVDVQIERGVRAAEAEVGSRAGWPIFVAEMALHDLVKAGRIDVRDRGEGPRFRVEAPRGVFGGVLAIGEGGLAYVALDGRVTGPWAALEVLRSVLVR